jgi:hypothetical protein
LKITGRFLAAEGYIHRQTAARFSEERGNGTKRGRGKGIRSCGLEKCVKDDPGNLRRIGQKGKKHQPERAGMFLGMILCRIFELPTPRGGFI